MKKPKFEIWVGKNRIEGCASLEEAQARVRTYERMDRYEVEVEGYGFPNGLPKYDIKEVCRV